MIPEDLREALTQWSQILTGARVLSDPITIDRYSGTTGVKGTRPSAVLFPHSVDEVALITKVAQTFHIPIYPISCGKNWGYGDACAPTDNQVILDLSQMNKIIEVNTKLGYVVIEPGVTQGQLWNYLVDNKTGLWMDATGAGPDTSLVGNTAERGFGHTRYGDHFQNTCGMEVVLANGEILKTGFGHYKNTRSEFVYRYGVGPVLDGLFTQSNFGIITRIGLWLMPEPEAFSAFFFSCPNEDDLSKVIEILAPLKLQGILQSAVHIANDLRTISGRVGYPWEQTNGQTPLPESIRKEMRNRFGFGAWNGCGSICGPKEVVNALKKTIKKAMKSYPPIFIDDKKLARAENILKKMPSVGALKTLKEKISIVRPTYNMLKGYPTTEHLKGALWRVRNRKDSGGTDLVKAGAGLIWVSPILPLDGPQAAELFNIMNPIYNKFGFETLVTFTLLTERSLACISNISFDRQNPDEVKRAMACYKELSSTLTSAGFYAYRTGPLGFNDLTKNSSVFWDVVRNVKQALDPMGIISPGRYQPPNK